MSNFNDNLGYLNSKLQRLIDCKSMITELTNEIKYANMLKECEMGIISREEIKESEIYKERHNIKKRMK